MKAIFIFQLVLFSLGAFAQQNFISLGYGLNIGDNKIFQERHHTISTNNLAAKLSYSRTINNFIRLKLDLAYADYDVTDVFINPNDPNYPNPIIKPYNRISASVGPQFKLFSAKNFTFLSGFNAGYHWGSDDSVSSNAYKASYFDFAINPLSISYQIKGFTVDVDSYIGSNMYANVFVGVGFLF